MFLITVASEDWGECVCYDNMMQTNLLHIMLPTDRKVNFNGRVLFCFWFRQGFEKVIEFWKCSSELINVVLTEESNFMAVLCLYLE